MDDSEQPTKNKQIQQIVKSQKAKMKCVPNWLVEVLEWIGHIEMANSPMSTASLTFKKLCWKKLHGNVKPYRVRMLKFWAERDECENIHVKLGGRPKIKEGEEDIIHDFGDFELLPIASIEPPKYILGFEEIIVNYMDEKIIQFLIHILPLCNDIHLECSMAHLWMGAEMYEQKVNQIRLLFEILNGKISGLYLLNSYIPTLVDHFPGLLDQIQFISLYDIQLDWLANLNNDGNQKIVKLAIRVHQKFEFFGHIIHDFFTATQRSNFLIIATYYDDHENDVEIDEHFKFKLENQQTDEIMTLYYKRNEENDEIQSFIARYPKGEEQWKEEGEQKYWQLIRTRPNSTKLILNIQDPVKILVDTARYQSKKAKEELIVILGFFLLIIFVTLVPILMRVYFR